MLHQKIIKDKKRFNIANINKANIPLLHRVPISNPLSQHKDPLAKMCRLSKNISIELLTDCIAIKTDDN